MLAGYNYTLAKIGWRYSPGEGFILDTRTAWMREKFDDRNPQKLLLGSGYYGEWVANQTATWVESPKGTLDFGWSARAIRDQGYSDQYQSNLTALWSGLVHISAGVLPTTT